MVFVHMGRVVEADWPECIVADVPKRESKVEREGGGEGGDRFHVKALLR